MSDSAIRPATEGTLTQRFGAGIAEQPEIARLSENVRLEIDPGLTAAYPARQGAEVVVSLRDGSVVSERLDKVVPASDEDVVRRFEHAAERRLGPERAQRLLDAVMSLEHASDAGGLARLAAAAA